MARQDSPGLDLSHGFIHMIRRNQLDEAKRTREANSSMETNSKKTRARLQSLKPLKVKRQDRPLYSTGKFHCSEVEAQPPVCDASTTRSVSQMSWDQPLQEMDDIEKVLNVADIDGYPLNDQDLLEGTIIDIRVVLPHMVPPVAKMIVERAYKDHRYEQPAATVCAHILQSEQHCVDRPRYEFRQALIKQCMEVLDSWPSLWLSGTNEGLRFGYFLHLLFNKVQPRGEERNVVGRVVIRLLTLLLQDIRAGNRQQLSVLRNMLKENGGDLESSEGDIAMRQLIETARDQLLCPDIDVKVRQVLLLIIELHASRWKLSPAAQCFYYDAH